MRSMVNKPPRRERLAASRSAPLWALGSRVGTVGRYDARVLRRSAEWLWRSRETTNFTYDLTPVNLDHLCWWVANVTGSEIHRVREVVRELLDDTALVRHVARASAASSRAFRADRDARFGRRAAWYALVRILRPELVVEAGTDQGLGALALGAALVRNGHGQLVTIDTNPASGGLLAGFDAPIEHVIGSSIDVIPQLTDLGNVDLFIHDSLHSQDYERRELSVLEGQLAPSAVVLSDNAHNTSALSDWAAETGRSFLFFQEQPLNHWYPGGGAGAAWMSP